MPEEKRPSVTLFELLVYEIEIERGRTPEQATKRARLASQLYEEKRGNQTRP